MVELQIKKFKPDYFYEMISERIKPIGYLSESERPDIDNLVKELKKVLFESFSGKNWCNGCLLPPSFHGNCAIWQFDNWKPSKEDVLIVTYPKSGTTWTREIVRQLFNKGNEKNMEISKSFIYLNTYLEASHQTFYDVYHKLPLKRRLYVTHLSSDCINMERIKESGCKIIYVLRNPKDTVVSWYHFLLNTPSISYEKIADRCPKEWSKFLETYMEGKQPDFFKENKWHPHHILSWYPYFNQDYVKVVHYEDIKKDPAGKIEEMSEFLECDRTKQEILEIVNATSFDSMKTIDGGEKKFYRKGVIGDWKNMFTVAQSELMDKKFNKVLSGIDIRFTYE